MNAKNGNIFGGLNANTENETQKAKLKRRPGRQSTKPVTDLSLSQRVARINRRLKSIKDVFDGDNPSEDNTYNIIIDKLAKKGDIFIEDDRISYKVTFKDNKMLSDAEKRTIMEQIEEIVPNTGNQMLLLEKNRYYNTHTEDKEGNIIYEQSSTPRTRDQLIAAINNRYIKEEEFKDLLAEYYAFKVANPGVSLGGYDVSDQAKEIDDEVYGDFDWDNKDDLTTKLIKLLHGGI